MATNSGAHETLELRYTEDMNAGTCVTQRTTRDIADRALKVFVYVDSAMVFNMVLLYENLQKQCVESICSLTVRTEKLQERT